MVQAYKILPHSCIRLALLYGIGCWSLKTQKENIDEAEPEPGDQPQGLTPGVRIGLETA